jgi:hypothetical protein
MTLTRDELLACLISAGELEVSGEDQAETDSYFDTTQFRFHGPDGFEADYSGLTRSKNSFTFALHRGSPLQARCDLATRYQGMIESPRWRLILFTTRGME